MESIKDIEKRLATDKVLIDFLMLANNFWKDYGLRDDEDCQETEQGYVCDYYMAEHNYLKKRLKAIDVLVNLWQCGKLTFEIDSDDNANDLKVLSEVLGQRFPWLGE